MIVLRETCELPVVELSILREKPEDFLEHRQVQMLNACIEGRLGNSVAQTILLLHQ